MYTINPTDLIQVSVHSANADLLSFAKHGFSDLKEIFRHIRETMPSCCGMINIRLRNRTQGWVQQHNLVFRNIGKKTRTDMSVYPSLFTICAEC